MPELRKVFFHRYPTSFRVARTISPVGFEPTGETKARSKEELKEKSKEEPKVQALETEKKREVLETEPKREVQDTPAREFPDEANTCRSLCRTGVRKRNFYHVLYYVQILFLSVATVVAAVLYGHYYTGYPSLDGDRLQLILFGLTIVLPIIVPILQEKEMTIPKSQCYQEISARIEAEVFKFRTFSPPYQDKSFKATELFKSRLGELLGNLQEELESDRIKVPEGEVFLAAAPERNIIISTEGSVSEHQENRELDETSEEQKQDEEEGIGSLNGEADVPSLSLNERFLSWLPKWKSVEKQDEEQKEEKPESSNYLTFVYKADPDSYLDQYAELPYINQKSLDSPKIYDEEEQPLLMDPTPIVAPVGADPTEPVGCATRGELPTTTEPEPEPSASEEGEDEEEIDDGSLALSAPSYVKTRLQPWLEEHRGYVKTLQFWKAFLDKLIILVDLSAVGAAAMAKQWTVPMLLVFATALHRTFQVSAIQHRIEVAQKAVTDMEELESWWLEESAGDPEKIEEEMRTKVLEQLVEKSESIIIEASSQ